MSRCALVCVGVVLALSGCAAGDGTVLRPAAVEQDAAPAVAADLRPVLAEQAELATLVLAAGPDAATAEVVQSVARDVETLLAAADAALAPGASPAGTAALTEQEVAAVRAAAGDEAVRLGLAALSRSQLAAVSRAKAAVLEGITGADRALADQVLAAQGASLQALAGLG